MRKLRRVVKTIAKILLIILPIELIVVMPILASVNYVVHKKANADYVQYVTEELKANIDSQKDKLAITTGICTKVLAEGRLYELSYNYNIAAKEYNRVIDKYKFLEKFGHKDKYEIINMSELESNYIAHRGLSGCYSENTYNSILLAGLAHAKGVEIDVQTTSDNVIILMHDLSLGRTTNGQGTVNYTPYSYISRLTVDVNQRTRVPKLEQILPILEAYDMTAFIELKGNWSYDNLVRLVDMVKDYNVSIISFNTSYLYQVRKINQDVGVQILSESRLSKYMVDKCVSLGNCSLSLKYNYNYSLSDEVKQYAKDSNVKFGFWTVYYCSTKFDADFILNNYNKCM